MELRLIGCAHSLKSLACFGTMLWIKQLTQSSQHLTAHSLLNTNPKARLVEQESWWTMYDGPEFRHFISFVAVAEECNFGKAAQRLHIT